MEYIEADIQAPKPGCTPGKMFMGLSCVCCLIWIAINVLRNRMDKSNITIMTSNICYGLSSLIIIFVLCSKENTFWMAWIAMVLFGVTLLSSTSSVWKGVNTRSRLTEVDATPYFESI